jgi:uncharacterized protein
VGVVNNGPLMNVAISGGTGLIGGALAASLAADGEGVRILTRNPSRYEGCFPGCEVVGWAGTRPENLAEALAGVDAVVHLAGESLADGRWTAARKQRLRDSRIHTTQALTAAIERLAGRGEAPTVFVQGSAVGIYGPRGDEELDEASSTGQDFLATLCRDWEAASEPLDRLGVRRLMLRSGVVLSARGGALPRMVLPFRLFAGGPIGSGKQWVPWIHLDDMAGAIRFLLGRPQARGPFNLVAPEPVRNRELAKLLGKILHRPAFLPAPALALKLLLGEMSMVVLESQRAAPAKLAEAGYVFRFSEAEAALRDLLG